MPNLTEFRSAAKEMNLLIYLQELVNDEQQKV